MIGRKPKNKRERRAEDWAREQVENPPPLDYDPPLVNDVWTWESEAGSWIVSMQRAGIDRETIIEVMKRQKRVRLSPQDATRIYREFTESRK